MCSNLLFFNPEHDLALANNDPNFMAPQSALQLQRDLEMLPVWYAQNGDAVFCRKEHKAWFKHVLTLFPQLKSIRLTDSFDSAGIREIIPWGWDNAVCTFLKRKILIDNSGSSEILPSESNLDKIRSLSHRRLAILACNFIQQQCSDIRLPSLAEELTNTNVVDAFVTKHSAVVFKSPWSGSGKGLSWVHNGLTDSHRGWCKRIINKQGSVIAEPIYDVKQNFAMLYACKQGAVSFVGYSLFETEKGIYRNNILMSNEAIYDYLTTNFIQELQLQEVNKALSEFIRINIAPHYSGVLGVDMFVFAFENEMCLHPCVEINLRMTMGTVARYFYDKFVQTDATGGFYIDHFENDNSLLKDHIKRTTENPLIVEYGRILQGYFPLTEVCENTCYRVRVEIY